MSVNYNWYSPVLQRNMKLSKSTSSDIMPKTCFLILLLHFSTARHLIRYSNQHSSRNFLEEPESLQMNENWYNHDYPVDPFGENTSRKTRALIAGVRSEFRFKPVEIPSLDWAGEFALKDARTLMHTYKRWNEKGHGDFFLPRHLPLF